MEEELLSKYLQETGGEADFLEAIPPKDIQFGRLEDILERVPEEGTFIVISHYGTLANAVAGDPIPAEDITYEAVRIIHKGLVKFKDDLLERGDKLEKFNPKEIIMHRRTLAVLTYLCHRALSGMEAKSVAATLGSGQVGKGKSKGATGAVNWRNLRSMLIEDIYEILKLPVEKIWDDSGYGFSVPRLLIRTMCSNFNEACLAKENLQAGDEPYKIFAILAKRFDKATDVYQRLFPLLKYGDDVAKLVARSVDIMANEFGLSDAVQKAFVSILSIVEATEGSDKNAAVAEKGAASLVQELCESTPKDVIQCAGFHLNQLLKQDSAAIRSATLQGAGHLLTYLRDNDGSTSHHRKLKTMIVEEMLIPHCRDVNALVRGKALTVLGKLVQEESLGPTDVAKCMTAAIDRITDSAVLPRKYSMSVINAILTRYPGICGSINFKEEVVNHRKRLLEMMLRKALNKSYYVAALVREFCEQMQDQEIPLPEEFEEHIEGGMSRVRPLITELVQEERYWEACLVLYYAFSRYSKESNVVLNVAKIIQPKVYISYFNNLANGQGTDDESMESRSILERSIDLTKTFSQDNEMEFPESDEITNERVILKFSEGCLRMKRLLPDLLEKLIELLQLGTPNDRTDVVSTIGEMVRCGYPINEKITGPVIQAIGSLGKDSASALVPAFWSIFIGEEGLGNLQMVVKLFQIVESVDDATRDLLKPIIGEMHRKGQLTKGHLGIVWDAFSQLYEWTERDARNAVFIIGAVARDERGIMTANFNRLMDIGLGEKALEDFNLIRRTLEAILFCFKTTKKGESDILTTHRLRANHSVFDKICEILIYGLKKKGNLDTHRHFPRVAELSLQVLYRISWDHTKHLERLLQSIPKIVFGETENVEGPQIDDNVQESEMRDTEELHMRYLSVMTAILGTHINYCETVVIPEIKRRKVGTRVDALVDAMSKSGMTTSNTIASLNASNANSTAASAISRNTSRRGTSSKGRSRKGGRASNAAANAMAEMEAIIGNVGFDSDIELVRTYVEKLLERGVFLQFRRLTLYFCKKIATVKHYKLKLAIVHALAKLMLVSADSVKKLIEPFIGVWTTVDDNRVKVEILKQLTTLNVRFPNQVEQCNEIIKRGLQTEDPQIKTACLDLMGYLALGDLVKVRDSIAEVAICLTSNKLVIRELARDFFEKCADKENAVSNAVPEVISQLSGRQGLEKDDFHTIMRFLLDRVKKEKQVTSLVETLINRFKGQTRSIQLSEDIAYCIAHLPQSERTFKFLRDNLPTYANKFESDEIYNAFQIIIESTRKVLLKPDLKAKLDDFEREIDEHREKCVEKARIANVGSKKRRNSGASEASSLMDEGTDEEEAEAADNGEAVEDDAAAENEEAEASDHDIDENEEEAENVGAVRVKKEANVEAESDFENENEEAENVEAGRIKNEANGEEESDNENEEASDDENEKSDESEGSEEGENDEEDSQSQETEESEEELE